jgi:hypothetical protein
MRHDRGGGSGGHEVVELSRGRRKDDHSPRVLVVLRLYSGIYRARAFE